MGFINGVKREIEKSNAFDDFVRIQKLKLDGIEVQETPKQIAFREYIERLCSADKKIRIGFY